MTPRPRIFGIGLNKTGTISLHKAFETLGFRSLHWGGPTVRMAVERAIEDGRPLLDDVGGYDAYSDIEVLSLNFDVLHGQYPGSRFVLTTRDVEAWVDSRRRHVERNLRRKAEGTYDGNFLTVDEGGWRDAFHAHHARVHAFFADHPGHLLVMDITAGEGYDALCPFLDVPAPDTAFPWRHRDPDATADP